jgi:hypothetical protein
METPLNASSTTAGGLLSGGRFRVPQFQREYAWDRDEVLEFFNDLSGSLNDDTYFLGLVIVTGEGQTKDVVDGQQRLLTLTLLASAIYHQARKYERHALAERLQSAFLRSIDFASDAESPRLELASESDSATLHEILDNPADDLSYVDETERSVSGLLLTAYRALSDRLVTDLSSDPFRRLGMWADFLTNKLYFAVFVHPNPASAYKVFEVINTRGKELTTADLLKSYVLSQTRSADREQRYQQWQSIAGSFGYDNANQFVQFIRHTVTTQRGHVLPRDLYDVLAGRGTGTRPPMPPEELVSLLEGALPAYLQMTDPTLEGPASQHELAVFSVLNGLNVVSVRPMILAMRQLPDASQAMRRLLRLVMRRIVVGNLGTGNVERRFGQAAQKIAKERRWEDALRALEDLNHDVDEFKAQVHRRSMNRNVLAVLRRSVIQETITPEPSGYLYFIKPRDADWAPADQDRAPYWASTIGNTFLATEARRPKGSSTWMGFNQELLPYAAEDEWVDGLASFVDWNIDAISSVGEHMAEAAADVWYS